MTPDFVHHDDSDGKPTRVLSSVSPFAIQQNFEGRGTCSVSTPPWLRKSERLHKASPSRSSWRGWVWMSRIQITSTCTE
jgi:hypothetical protein